MALYTVNFFSSNWHVWPGISYFTACSLRQERQSAKTCPLTSVSKRIFHAILHLAFLGNLNSYLLLSCVNHLHKYRFIIVKYSHIIKILGAQPLLFFKNKSTSNLSSLYCLSLWRNAHYGVFEHIKMALASFSRLICRRHLCDTTSRGLLLFIGYFVLYALFIWVGSIR